MRVKAGALQMLEASSQPEVRAQVQHHIHSSTKKIEQIRLEIQNLESPSTVEKEGEKGKEQEAQQAVVQLESSEFDFNGHSMNSCHPDRLRVSCVVCCRDSLSLSWLQCSTCGIYCHKECHGLLPVSCMEAESLARVLPVYFMAGSKDECRKWIQAIHSYRRMWLDQSKLQ